MKIEKVDIDILTWEEVEEQLEGSTNLRSWSKDEVWITRQKYVDDDTGKIEEHVSRGIVFYLDGERIGFQVSRGEDFVVINNKSKNIQIMYDQMIYETYGFKINQDGKTKI